MQDEIIEKWVEKKKLNTFSRKLKKHKIYIVLTLIYEFFLFAISFLIFGQHETYPKFYLLIVFGLLTFFNFLFSNYYIKRKLNTRIYSGIIVTMISFTTTYSCVILSKSYFKWVLYEFGFFAIPLIYIIISILIWELIDKYLSKRELSNLDKTTF